MLIPVQEACVSVFGNCNVNGEDRKSACKHCRYKICLAKVCVSFGTADINSISGCKPTWPVGKLYLVHTISLLSLYILYAIHRPTFNLFPIATTYNSIISLT